MQKAVAAIPPKRKTTFMNKNIILMQMNSSQIIITFEKQIYGETL
jgi:hypothetical protein